MQEIWAMAHKCIVQYRVHAFPMNLIRHVSWTLSGCVDVVREAITLLRLFCQTIYDLNIKDLRLQPVSTP